MSKYMRNKFTFYGIPSPIRKELTKPFIKEEKSRKVIDWDLLDSCYQDEHREMQYFVSDYLSQMNKYLVYDDIEIILKYIKLKPWWDTVDFLDKIIGNIDDIWLRIIAINHQNCRKDKTSKELLKK